MTYQIYFALLYCTEVIMYDFFAFTAWQMTPPENYGPFHLCFLIFGMAACVALAWLFRKSTEKQNKIILLSVGAFLLISEIYKQLFYTFYLGGGSYQWWIFPFQLCSVPMYICLVVPFVRSERVRGYFYTFLATYNLLGGFVAMFEQSGLSHKYITLTLHAYLWHLLLVFVGFYLIASGRAAKRIRDYLPAIGVFAGLCIIAQTINISFHHAKWLELVPADQDLKMFYISPYYTTPLIVFKQIEQACGWIANAFIYCFALTLGGFVFLIAGLLIKGRLGRKAKDRIAD